MKRTEIRKAEKWRENVTNPDTLFELATQRGRLNHSRLPATATENQGADDCERRKGNRYGGEDTFGTHAELNTEDIAERDFPEPEDEKVDDRGRPSVAGAVERLSEHHAIGVKQKAVSYDAKTVHTIASDFR
jgi:hypothetical protein